MKKLARMLCMAGLLAAACHSTGAEPSASKKAAVFVANRAQAELNDQMPVFEDMITSQLSGFGFEVISREVVLSATGDLLRQSGKNDLDAVLDDQTSALRLAQNLGADYLLFASFVGMDQEKRSVDAYGVKYDNYVYTLRGTYRILDGNTGGSLAAGMVEPSRAIQQTQHSETTSPGLIRELLARAGREMAASLQQKTMAGQIRDVTVATGQVEFQIAASLENISFPQAEVDGDGNVNIVSKTSAVDALAVTVELDGMVIGSIGGDGRGTLRAAPGIHRIRLLRDDLVPYERMINVHEGMQLNIAMTLNEEGLRRWHEKSRVFDELLRKTKLNDAEVERIRGEAQMLRQSGYKVDIHVETKEGLTLKKNQSLFNQE